MNTAGWMRCDVPYQTDPEPVQEALFAAALGQARTRGAIDPGVMLLVRMSDDRDLDHWFLSPAGSVYAEHLPGDWRPTEKPSGGGWSVLYSAGVSLEELGLEGTEGT